jgi:hypothetical protein
LSDFDLRALLEALHERSVDFVVIGGVAVGAHGYVRGTEDLDLVPDRRTARTWRTCRRSERLFPGGRLGAQTGSGGAG